MPPKRQQEEQEPQAGSSKGTTSRKVEQESSSKVDQDKLQTFNKLKFNLRYLYKCAGKCKAYLKTVNQLKEANKNQGK